MPFADQFPDRTPFATMLQAFEDLKSGGVALASHYEVFLAPPSGHPNQNAARNISMRCKTVAMPGMNLATSPDVNMYAVQQEVVDGVTFSGSTNMVFTASQDFRERKWFEQWQGLAWNKSTWNIGYYNDYVGSAEIYLLDKFHHKVFGIVLHEIFPKEINGTDLSAAPATTALELTVQMQYKWWDTLDLNRQPDTSSVVEPPPVKQGSKQTVIETTTTTEKITEVKILPQNQAPRARPARLNDF